ncbi:hypothetical protein V1264_007285 [Littorina saxatilis]|uniref:Uncharacterized protein n=1 Tax=Littorina saxatilis TaxID=31220 RepID=A0AAN9G3J4_9CAEN
MDEAAAYSELEDLLHEAILSDLDADSPPLETLHHSRPHFFRNAPPQTPTDTPTLRDLMRSALRTDMVARKSYDVLDGTQLLKQGGELSEDEGEALLKRALQGGKLSQKNGGDMSKRSFDSISRSSGFGGMNRGSWGGGRQGDNLTFTFESLFPAIARGLRSSN